MEKLSCSPLTKPALEFLGRAPNPAGHWIQPSPFPGQLPRDTSCSLSPQITWKSQERFQEKQESGSRAHGVVPGKGWDGAKNEVGKTGGAPFICCIPPFPPLFQGRVPSQSWGQTNPSKTNLDPNLGWTIRTVGASGIWTKLGFSASSCDFPIPKIPKIPLLAFPDNPWKSRVRAGSWTSSPGFHFHWKIPIFCFFFCSKMIQKQRKTTFGKISLSELKKTDFSCWGFFKKIQSKHFLPIFTFSKALGGKWRLNLEMRFHWSF